MGKHTKLREKVLSGRADRNIEFVMLCQLLKRIGFVARVKGSHHIFTHSSLDEIINIQPKGGKAKPYQVKQIRELLEKYRLGEDNVEI